MFFVITNIYSKKLLSSTSIATLISSGYAENRPEPVQRLQRLMLDFPKCLYYISVQFLPYSRRMVATSEKLDLQNPLGGGLPIPTVV